ncbi:unnamed protein product [Closterium sp. NIES-64]|nr:unnamed protein product [Closterium sp. NIES-64]
MLLVGLAVADNQDRKRDGTGNQDRDRKRDGSCAKSGTCTGNKNGGNPGGRGGNGAGRGNQGKKGTGMCNKSGSASCDGSGRKNAVMASANAVAAADVAAADVDVQACDGAKQAGKLMSGLRKSGFNKFAAALQHTGLAAEFPEVMCGQGGGVTVLAIPDAPMGQLPPSVRGDPLMLREQLLLHVVKGARPYSRMQARGKNYKAAAVTRPDAFRCTGGAVHGVNCALGLGRMGRPGRRVPLGQCLRNGSDQDDD